ncbi:hypothetical protein ACSBQY_10445 [Micrococcus lylae]|uniref:hypothetical protein n=1 Tax=Micrococcus lylae TaxID=1273 RepID=UPI003EB7B234
MTRKTPAYTREDVNDFISRARTTRPRPPVPQDLPPLTAADGSTEPPLPTTEPDDREGDRA